MNNINDNSIVITYTDENNEENTLITSILSAAADLKTTKRATVTTFPVGEGSVIADHMYLEPISLTIDGKFSAYGYKQYINNGSITSLQEIQTFFNNIQENSTICDITKLSYYDGNSIQFADYINMVLSNITWTESVNCLGYSFTFTEIIRAEISETDVDETYYNYSVLETVSFSDTALDWDYVDEEIIQALYDADLISYEFLEYLNESLHLCALVIAGAALVAIIIAAVTGVITLCATGVGAIIVAGALIIIGFYNLIKSIWSTFKKFRLYNSVKKNEAEMERFVEFFAEMHEAISELDSVVTLYAIAENSSQDAIVAIDGTYYIFEFYNGEDDETYLLRICDFDDNTYNETSINNHQTAYLNCTSKNAILTTDSHYVHLLLLGSDETDLTSYYVCVSSINPDSFSEMLQEIILEALEL